MFFTFFVFFMFFSLLFLCIFLVGDLGFPSMLYLISSNVLFIFSLFVLSNCYGIYSLELFIYIFSSYSSCFSNSISISDFSSYLCYFLWFNRISHSLQTLIFTSVFFFSFYSIYTKFISNVPNCLLFSHFLFPQDLKPFPYITSFFVLHLKPILF